MAACPTSPESDLPGTTTAELIALVLGTPDEDEATWEPALEELQQRATRETFDAAVALLLDLLQREAEPRVLESLAYAFESLDERRGVAPLTALADHPETRVRFAVVHGLMRQDDERAVATLSALTADEDADVRNWATFGLGSQLSRDTPAIRDTLAARLADEHHDTREESMHALAMRLDERAVPVLLEFLDDYEGPMRDSALLVLAEHVDDSRLPAAVAERWPDGVPDEAREEAATERWRVSPDGDPPA